MYRRDRTDSSVRTNTLSGTPRPSRPLETESGALLMDTPGYPQDYRSFYLAHAAAADVLASSDLDWLTIAPAGDFDHAHPDRTGKYRTTPAEATSRISYADFAIALLDEVDAPQHHHTLLGVEAG
jgi:putative NADH-flavin reductase